MHAVFQNVVHIEYIVLEFRPNTRPNYYVKYHILIVRHSFKSNAQNFPFPFYLKLVFGSKYNFVFKLYLLFQGGDNVDQFENDKIIKPA